jgi:phage-related tail fiber protein
MNQYYTIITDYGEAQLAAAVNGSSITLSTMIFGDGAGNVITPDPTASELINEVYRAPLSELLPSTEHVGWQRATASIPADVGSFTIREIGLLDQAGKLFALGSFHPTDKLSGNDPLLSGIASALTVDCYLAVSNAAQLHFILDPNIAIASQQYVKNQLEAIRFSAYFIGQS